MLNRIWWRIFANRSVICYLLLLSLFFSGFLRVIVISTTEYKDVLETHGRLKLEVSPIRGTIYDCNMIPLTNTKTKIIAAVSPTERAKSELKKVLDAEQFRDVLTRLEAGKPILLELPKKVYCEDIYCTSVYYDDEPVIAPHTLGYLSNEYKGVSGIQKAYESNLNSGDSVYFSFACDGIGEILEGVEPEIHNNSLTFLNSVVTTLDINIQNIIEQTANPLTKGAVIVAEAETLKIRGVVSRPNFDNLKLSDYLNDTSSPLFNRAINAYAVGSAFKPCVAAAAIENSLGGTKYNCVGNMQIIDRSFNCHERDGHGLMTLEYALANSCNTYFYNLALKTGGNKVFQMADTLHFGQKLKLCDGIYTANGNIPTNEKLKNDAHLANFSIGQGDFTASPVSMLTLYSAIANGGKYYIPSLIEGIYDDGEFIKYDSGYPTKVMSETTAQTIKAYLKTVINAGTGGAAKPKTVTAAGKTATAQTGKFENGREILASWFCGFFPADNPKYIIIVFCENSSLQTESCAEIFSKTADKITSLSVDKY